MSTRAILMALAGAFGAASTFLDTAAAEMGGDEVKPKTPPARAAVASGAATGKGGGKAPTKGKGSKAATPAVDFDTIKEKLLTVAKEGTASKPGSKELAVACMQRFGVEKLGDLSPEQYDEFNVYMDAVLADEEDPLAAAGGGEEEDLL